jgi:signal transduction histidine kinase
LIRDRAERELIRLEAGVRTFILESPPEFDNLRDLQEWLDRLQSANSFLAHPLIVHTDGGVLSTLISRGWTTRKPGFSVQSPVAAVAFQSAEAAEFAKQDLTEALRLYRRAFQATASIEDQTLIRARIGRCNLKLGRYRESIADYSKVLELKADRCMMGSLPASVVALSQTADAYQTLGDTVNFKASIARLYEYILWSPWDIAGGEYLFYLSRARDAMRHSSIMETQREGALEHRERAVLDQVQAVDVFAENVLPKIRATQDPRMRPELRTQHISIQSDGTLEQFGFLSLPGPLQEKGIVGVGYQFRSGFLSTELLPNILESADLEPNVVVVVLNERDSVLFGQAGLEPVTRLATESFLEVFPSWKVTLIDRQGQSIDELVGSERTLYLLLFGGIVFVMAMGILLTLRAAAHEAEVSRLKAEFVSNVSHELKTPLTLIRMFGETLESGLVADEAKRKEFSGIIRKESERLTDLINNVLDFSKMDAGRKEYRFEETDLVEVVRTTVEAYAYHIRDLGFAIESLFPTEPIYAQLDRDAISQAILNILSNATKYSHEEKHIDLGVVRRGPVAIIAVEDRGVGIPKESLRKIFDKFYRVPNDKTRETRGTGLGLTLTKHIIEAHHGTIEVESAIGKGSTFTIKLPIQTGGTT